MHKRASKGDVAQNALRVVEAAIEAPLKQAKKPIQFRVQPKKKIPQRSH
jgi:hypothetical protein